MPEPVTDPGGERPPTRSPVRVLLLCLLVGLVLRVLAAGYSGSIKRDGAFYADLGAQLKAGDPAGMFHPRSTPLYPFLIGLVHLIVDDLELAGLVVSVVAGVLVILLVYWLGRLLFDERVGLVAAGLCAVHPYLVRYSGYVMTETTYTLTFALALVAIWLAVRRGGWWRYLLAGGAIGLAYLARLEGMGLAALLVLGALLPRQGKGLKALVPRLGTLAGVVLAAGVFLVVAFPQLYFVKQQMGVWSLTPKAVLSVDRNRMTPQAFERYKRTLTRDKRTLVVDAIFDQRYRAELLADRTRERPREALTTLAGRWLRVLGRLLAFLPEVHGPLLLLFLVGLLYRRTHTRRAGPELYLGVCLLLYLAALSFFQGSRRNLTALVVPMLFWMAIGLDELAALAARWRAGERVSPGRLSQPGALPQAEPGGPAVPSLRLAQRWCLALLLAVTVAATLPMTLRFAPRADWRWRGSAEKEVGRWVQEALGPGRIVLANDRTVPFYARARFFGLPLASCEDIVTYARLNGVDALLLEERETQETPEWAELAHRAARDPQWEEAGSVMVLRKGKAQRYVLYRLSTPEPPANRADPS